MIKNEEFPLVLVQGSHRCTEEVNCEVADAVKLPGNVRRIRNGFEYESEIIILKAVVGFVKFRDETLLRGRGCNIPDFCTGIFPEFLERISKRAETRTGPGRELGVWADPGREV